MVVAQVQGTVGVHRVDAVALHAGHIVHSGVHAVGAQVLVLDVHLEGAVGIDVQRTEDVLRRCAARRQFGRCGDGSAGAAHDDVIGILRTVLRCLGRCLKVGVGIGVVVLNCGLPGHSGAGLGTVVEPHTGLTALDGVKVLLHMGEVKSLEDGTAVVEVTGDLVLGVAGLDLSTGNRVLRVAHEVGIPGKVGLDAVGGIFLGSSRGSRCAGRADVVNVQLDHVAGVGIVGQGEMDVGGVSGVAVLHIIHLDGQGLGGQAPHVVQLRLAVVHCAGLGVGDRGSRRGLQLPIRIRIGHHAHGPVLIGQVGKVAQAAGVGTAAVLNDLLALGGGVLGGGVAVDVDVVVLGILHTVKGVAAVLVHCEVARGQQGVGVQAGRNVRAGSVLGSGGEHIGHLLEVGAAVLAHLGAAAGQHAHAQQAGQH